MALEIRCSCGFHQVVPDQWQGMRLKCKCGRTFVIGEEGGIEEPPVATAPPTPAASTPSHRPDPVVERYRARHPAVSPHRRLVATGAALVAFLAMTAAAMTFVFLPEMLPFASRRPVATNNNQVASTEEPETGSGAKGTPAADVTIDSPPKRSDTTREEVALDTDSALATEIAQLSSRVAETIELTADDGLLLTETQEDICRQLDCSEEQRTQVSELAAQLTTQADALRSGEQTLEHWYVEGDRIGKALLAVLTDEQRATLRTLIERDQLKRLRLEEYAASLRPELKVPRVTWDVEPDSLAPTVFRESSLTGSVRGACLRASMPGRVFAFSVTQEDQTVFEVWNLETGQKLGNCSVPSNADSDTTRLARDGSWVVRGTPHAGGEYRVQAWPVTATGSARSKSIPAAAASRAYQLVDCVGHRVVCVSGRGYWLWDLAADTAREVAFPDWIPEQMPCSVVSPAGMYLAVAHPHHLVLDSGEYNFLEVCVYDLESGELLGNQILARDYLSVQAGALAYSHDGRQLALLWEPADATAPRRVIQLNAANGNVVRTAGELPASSDGVSPAIASGQRELMWLPDGSGWIVGLQSLVETDSGSVIEIELPTDDAEKADGMSQRGAIIDAWPLDSERMLLLTLEPDAGEVTAQLLKTRIIDLPHMGPFL